MPEAFEFSDEALGFAFRISSLLVVVGAEVLEDLARGEEVPDHVGEAVSNGRPCWDHAGLRSNGIGHRSSWSWSLPRPGPTR